MTIGGMVSVIPPTHYYKYNNEVGAPTLVEVSRPDVHRGAAVSRYLSCLVTHY